MFSEGKGRAWVNGDIQCTLYICTWCTYTGTTKCTPDQDIYVDQPLFYGSILFQNETSTNFLKWLGWDGVGGWVGVLDITFDSEGLWDFISSCS